MFDVQVALPGAPGKFPAVNRPVTTSHRHDDTPPPSVPLGDPLLFRRAHPGRRMTGRGTHTAVPSTVVRALALAAVAAVACACTAPDRLAGVGMSAPDLSALTLE